MDQTDTLTSKVSALESKVGCLKKTKLQDRCVKLENLHLESEQRARMNNIEIKDVPTSNSGNLFTIVDKIGVINFFFFFFFFLRDCESPNAQQWPEQKYYMLCAQQTSEERLCSCGLRRRSSNQQSLLTNRAPGRQCNTSMTILHWQTKCFLTKPKFL